MKRARFRGPHRIHIPYEKLVVFLMVVSTPVSPWMLNLTGPWGRWDGTITPWMYRDEKPHEKMIMILIIVSLLGIIQE